MLTAAKSAIAHRYVYQLRDVVRLYGTEEESANSLPELERTEEWLYNEGSATDNPGAYVECKEVLTSSLVYQHLNFLCGVL